MVLWDIVHFFGQKNTAIGGVSDIQQKQIIYADPDG